MEHDRRKRPSKEIQGHSSSPDNVSSHSRDTHSYRKKRHYYDHGRRNDDHSLSSKKLHGREYDSRPSSSRMYDESRSQFSRDETHVSKYQDSRQRHTKGKNSSPGNADHIDLNEFSFLDHRRELTKIFSHDSSLISDIDDLWKFVAKYEALQKKKGESVLSSSHAGKVVNDVKSIF